MCCASIQSDPWKILLTGRAVEPASPILPLVSQTGFQMDTILGLESTQSLDILESVSQHDYFQSTPKECITFLLAGDVAHKLRKFTSSKECMSSLSDSQYVSADAKLIKLKTRGGRKLPSVSLTVLIILIM